MSSTKPEVEKTPPAPEADAPETPATPEDYTPTRIPQNGIVTAADLPRIADEFLKYVFLEESKQINADSKYGQANKKTGKNEVSGYRSQYIINALNEVIGPGNWREYGKMETEKPATAFVSIYSGTLEIGNWKNEMLEEVTQEGTGEYARVYKRKVPTTYFEVLARFEQIGGSRNLDKWESMKGAKTNFLKKVASYISNGWKSYALVMDEDWNQAPPETEKLPPVARTERAPANAGTNPTNPGTAAAKLISTDEYKVIMDLFGRLGYAAEQIPERVKALEERVGKPLAEFTQGEARDTIKQMEARIIKQSEVVPEVPVDDAPLPEAAE